MGIFYDRKETNEEIIIKHKVFLYLFFGVYLLVMATPLIFKKFYIRAPILLIIPVGFTILLIIGYGKANK